MEEEIRFRGIDLDVDPSLYPFYCDWVTFSSRQGGRSTMHFRTTVAEDYAILYNWAQTAPIGYLILSSISKLLHMLRYGHNALYVSSCALCLRFLVPTTSCDGCPVKEYTGKDRCHDTPENLKKLIELGWKLYNLYWDNKESE